MGYAKEMIKKLTLLLPFIFILGACTTVQKPRELPYLTKGIVYDKYTTDDKYVIIIDVKEHDALRNMGNDPLFTNKVRLYCYASKAVYDSYEIGEDIPLLYQFYYDKEGNRIMKWQTGAKRHV